MVGNDVVDLRDREAHRGTLSDRFDERVFHPDERETLAWSEDRRWLLWAAKEAAYKVAVKRDPAATFAPLRFRVRLGRGTEREARGTVAWDSGAVPVRVQVSDAAVHAVASPPESRLVVGLERLAPAEPGARVAKRLSGAVRSLATRRLAESLDVAAAQIEIRKLGRLPVLFVAGERAAADLSLSHHGDVVGFACEMRDARPASRRAPPARAREGAP